jgi:serine protease
MVDAGMQERWRGLAGRGLLAVLASLVPVLCLLLAAGAAQAAEKTIQRLASPPADAAQADDDGTARVIVKYRQGSNLALGRRGARQLGKQLQLVLEDGHVLGARSQSLRGRGIGAQALAARLAADPDVEWAQPVRRKTVRALLPNDPLFADNQTTTTPVAGQWYLRAPDATLVSAVNAVGAWAITTGSAGITVAVLDTGVRFDHPDLAGKLWPGYDFVTPNDTANDNQPGRDADASDPGDWNPTPTSSCPDPKSSWHGTQVAGLIGAATDNGIGMAAVGRDTMVLPVRVLGRCGGYDDDIIAGMRWAAGLGNGAGCSSTSAASAGCNPHPARVLNLSLGSPGACSNAYRDVIAELNRAGVVVVVASGNDTGRAVNEPANCPFALAVAGVRHAGTKVGYSSLGPQVAIAAPAGNCVNTSGPCLYPLVTTLNAGTTTPGASVYSSSSDPSLGTSFAAPIVAAAAALMLAVDPAQTPAQVKATLQATARLFPSVGAQEPGTVACRAPGATDQIECYCTTTTCGAGLLDAGAAVARAAGARSPPAAVPTFSTASPTVGVPFTAEAVSSSRDASIVQWVIEPGGAAARFLTSSSVVTTRVDPQVAGAVTLSLMVTDAFGQSSTATKTFNVVSAPFAQITSAGADITAGTTVTLSGVGTAFGGRTVTAYAWSVVAGSATLVGATTEPTASLSANQAGQVEVRLTITDSAGATAVASQTITIAAAPVVVVAPPAAGGSSGGGAMGGGWLLGLAAAVLLLRRTAPR